MTLSELADAVEGLAKVKLNNERQRYTIMARNDRFVIMTKPFNAKRTYIYTIADLERGVRGPCNLIFGLPCDVNTPAGAHEALQWIERGDMEVSFRRFVDLSDEDKQALRAKASGEGA
ncbi:hypothetical protein [Sphingobium sp. UBA5915]|uniref:hypothetical protein n=1 Tax=Sphingobium sp. UBA5915 TaxID=1947530 RepID=UPI0025D7643E|nr:hypothetical protein [Sphingobium sp. UBA5915]